MHLPLLTLYKGLKLIVPTTTVCELVNDLSPHQVEKVPKLVHLFF